MFGFVPAVGHGPVFDVAAERLVETMLAPRLRQRLELTIGGIAAQRFKMFLNGLHLGDAEKELPFRADAGQIRFFG